MTSAAQVVISSVILIILFRVLSREIGVSGVGAWSVVMALLSFAKLAEVGLQTSVVRSVARAIAAKDNPVLISSTVLAAAGFVAVSVGVVLTLLWPVCVWVMGRQEGKIAREIVQEMPLILIGAWFASLASVCNGALDGMSRVDLRNLIVVAGQTVLLITTECLTPTEGLKGLAIAYLGQGAISTVLSIIVFRVHFGYSWSGNQARKSLAEMLRYGVVLVPSALMSVCFDPTTRFLFLWVGGLEMTGLYEMASRVVTQLRAVFVFAFQATISHFAAASSGQAVRTSLLRAQAVIRYLVPAVFSALISVTGLISQYWLHHLDMGFVALTVALTISWGVNSFVTAGYYALLGIGRPSWTMGSHLLMGTANLFVSGLLGLLAGPAGVVAGNCIAIMVGVIPVVRGVRAEMNVSLRLLSPWPWVMEVAAFWALSLIVLGLSAWQLSSDKLMLAAAIPASWGCVLAMLLVATRARLNLERVTFAESR